MSLTFFPVLSIFLINCFFERAAMPAGQTSLPRHAPVYYSYNYCECRDNLSNHSLTGECQVNIRSCQNNKLERGKFVFTAALYLFIFFIKGLVGLQQIGVYKVQVLGCYNICAHSDTCTQACLFKLLMYR